MHHSGSENCDVRGERQRLNAPGLRGRGAVREGAERGHTQASGRGLVVVLGQSLPPVLLDEEPATGLVQLELEDSFGELIEELATELAELTIDPLLVLQLSTPRADFPTRAELADELAAELGRLALLQLLLPHSEAARINPVAENGRFLLAGVLRLVLDNLDAAKGVCLRKLALLPPGWS